ncbi:MAG: 16S rRNA (uracil(1498)-N(3))-methyltransferase [Clostridia bacterium]|nr:16S rRNA (uracil(1498)-N(3))-methyltransferase [Clostridia bacterium]
MPRFFVSPEAVNRDGKTVLITGDDAHHIARSLRMAVGETVSVCDGGGTVLTCRLEQIRDDCAVGAILSEERSASEPPYRLTVFQALVKGDRTDTAIQKSVESGAHEIVLFESSRCVMRRGDSDGKKLDRFRRIAHEAAKQSGRGVLPEVSGPVSFRDAVKAASENALSLFCYEDESRTLLGDALPDSTPASVSVMIGPEGGFSPEEAEIASAAGLKSVSLGNRILRTESAAPFTLACLAFKYELNR